MTIPTKNYVGGPENINEYWYPMNTEVATANFSLRDLFNRIIEEKVKTIDIAKKDDIVKSDGICLVSGWYNTEMWGKNCFRWTDGEGIFKIMYKISDFKIKYKYIHEFEGAELKVFVDDILIFSDSMILKDSWTEIDIRLDEFQTLPLKIKIKTDFFIPRQCGISADIRKLGIAISEISCY